MVLGARTAAWSGGGLPYDAEVEYLKSNGSAYVNTGLSLDASFYNDNKPITCEFEIESGNCRMFGAGKDWKGYYLYAATNGYFDIAYYRGSQRQHTDLLTGSHKIEMKNAGYYIDGGTVNGWNLGYQGAFAGEFMVFAIMESSLQRSGLFQIKSLAIGDLRDFIPVRVGALGFLYDRLNPTGGPLGNGLYGNAAASNAGFPESCVGPDKT